MIISTERRKRTSSLPVDLTAISHQKIDLPCRKEHTNDYAPPPPQKPQRLLSISGFFVPGLGHIAQGYYLSGLLFLITGITLITGIATTGLLHSNLGLEGVILGLAAIHCLSAGTSYRLAAKSRPSTFRKLLSCVGFILLSCALYFGLFLNRTALLGTDIYQVVSDSMLPTLQPGDYILVDTWKHKKNPLSPGTIITFQSPLNGQLTVKRISDINTDTQPERLFVLGDNPEHSFDSRTYGWLDKDMVTGTVTRIFSNPLP